MKSGKQLIDVEAAKGYVETFMADPILKLAANAVLNNTPRVDAVEVVRCKECKFGEMCSVREAMACVDENGFCWRGERRNNG